MTPEQAEDTTHDAVGSDLSLGRELRRAREVRGIPLEQVVALTKISERYLLALENDRLDLLPGRLYARNFVRAYAKAIGADEDELLDYFSYQSRRQDEEVGTQGTEGHSGSTRRVVAVAVLAAAALVIAAVLAWSLGRGSDSAAGDAAAARAAASAKSKAAAAKPGQESTPGGVPAAAAPDAPAVPAGAAPAGREAKPQPGTTGAGGKPTAAAVGAAPAPGGTAAGSPAAGGAAAPRKGVPAQPPAETTRREVQGPVPSEARREAAQEEADAPRLLAATGASTPAAEKPVQPPAPAPTANAEAIPTVRLQFNEESWAEVRRGGEMLEVGLKRRGEVLSYRLDEPLSLVIGNAGGVALFIDGQAARPLGGASESRSLVLDRRNYRAFLP